MLAALVAEHVGEAADQVAGRGEFRAAGGDPGKRGAVIVGELAGRGEDPGGHFPGCGRWRRCRIGDVLAQPRGKPPQGAQASQVAAVAEFAVEPLGAADALVPSLAQFGLVRAGQSRPGQAGIADQLVRAGGGCVAAHSLAVQP